MLSFFSSRFSPLKSPLFLSLFLTQLFSQSGTWAFEIARTWIVVDRLGKGHELGLVMLSGALSTILFTLYGGALVDRLNFQQVLRTLILAKVLLFLLSIWLFYVFEFQNMRLWHLVVFSFLQGVITAYDSPAFFSMATKLVSVEDLQQALALNSLSFQASRILGPLLAGILMGIKGPGLVILLDGLSFLGPAIATLAVLKKNSSLTLQNPTDNFQGFSPLVKNPYVYRPLIQLFLCLAFFQPTILVTFRIYIKEVFDVSAETFSYIFMGPALGAFLGATFITLLKPKFPLKLLRFGLPLFILSTASVPVYLKYFSPHLALTMTILHFAISGFAAFFSFSAFTLHLHLQIKEAFRGRLTSVVMLGFMVVAPLASYPIGKLIDEVGSTHCLTIIPLTYVLVALLLHFFGYARLE